MKLAEGDVGQYDGIVFPTKNFKEIGSFTNGLGIFINYTQVENVLENKYNLVPRK